MSDQASQILAYLRTGKPLTALQALSRFHCLRLAARVHDLRAKGFRIGTFMVKVRSGKQVAEYRWLGR